MAQLNFGAAPPKDPAEKNDYSFIWKDSLLIDGDSIAVGDASSVWAVSPAGVTINTTDKAKTHDDLTTTVWLDPGSTAGDYILKNTIVTAEGRIRVGTATLKVVA